MIVHKFQEKQIALIRGIRSIDSSYAAAAANALIESIQKSDYIYFDASTMAMLRDKHEHYDEVMDQVQEILEGTLPDQLSDKLLQKASSASFPGGFIWFSEPLQEDKIEALFFYNIMDQHGHNIYNLLLVNKEGDVEYIMEAGSGQPWSFISKIHLCVDCTYISGRILPCTECGRILTYWSEILVLSTIIAGQYLAAKKYTEKSFTGTHKEKQTGGRKPKKRHVDYQVKIINATEIFVAVPTQEYIATHHESGTSWVDEALEKGDIEYVTITTRSFTRTYHRKDKEDITHYFTEGVKQNRPMKKSLAGHRVTKVTAPAYTVKKEGENNEP